MEKDLSYGHSCHTIYCAHPAPGAEGGQRQGHGCPAKPDLTYVNSNDWSKQ